MNNIKTTAILAMTVDGKIADYQSSAARFGSKHDKLHLEQQVSLVDGVIFGANTLRAYGTTLLVSDPQLIEARKKRSQFLQPVQIVVSASGNLNTEWRFFHQPVPRWLITTPNVARVWKEGKEFERILIIDCQTDSAVDWIIAFEQLSQLGLTKLAILGGGELVASLMQLNLIDELWLTVCPLIFGGKTSPTPVGGQGFLQSEGKRLKLLKVQQVESELFLQYQIMDSVNNQHG